MSEASSNRKYKGKALTVVGFPSIQAETPFTVTLTGSATRWGGKEGMFNRSPSNCIASDNH
jgi:hypothetical protein